MRVVFKIRVIGWGFGRETCIARFREARGTPSDGELRGKQRRNKACLGIFFTYHYGWKNSRNKGKTGMTSRLQAYRVQAYNTAKLSENKMHDDTVAKRFGFSGGLVPGVDVMAYMMHLPVAKWGRAFLERGLIEARFVKPVYDGEATHVSGGESDGVLTIEVESRGQLCATGSASLPASAPSLALSDFSEVAAVTERRPVDEASYQL